MARKKTQKVIEKKTKKSKTWKIRIKNEWLSV